MIFEKKRKKITRMNESRHGIGKKKRKVTRNDTIKGWVV
jgi:hypothetical protein